MSKYEVSEAVAWPPEKVDLLLSMLWDLLGLSPGRQVIELCCCGGWLVGGLAERGVRGTGVDFAPGMVRVARERWPEVTFIESDATACPLPDGCADAALCYATYDAAKERYFRRFAVTTQTSELRECCQPPIVLYSADQLLRLGECFREARVEPSFNHFWLPGEPTTCPWRVDLRLTK